VLLPVDFLGTLPGWITAISASGIFATLVTLIVAYWRRGISLKTLANADIADIRDHYAEELTRVVQRQHDCEAREQALRSRVTDLENDVLGLIRIIGQASADKVLQLGPDVPDVIRAMAERVRSRTTLDTCSDEEDGSVG
jgi:hypothetical protein